MMKKKTFFRRAAAVAVTAMVFCVMSVSVSAVGIGNGTATSNTSGDAAEVTIPKGLTFVNADSVETFGPDIKFVYTVAPVSSVTGQETVEKDNVTVTVKPGAVNGVLFKGEPANTDSTELLFGKTDKFTTSSEGVEAQKNLTLVVDVNTIGAGQPGIYRYVITDITTKEALFNAGIVRPANYDATRYLDVYVKRTAGGELEVSGYVLREEQESENKDNGFVKDDTITTVSSAKNAVDTYTSYNVKITKVVAGEMGDTAHEFPFTASVSNKGIPYTAGTAVTEDSSLSFTLKNGESYELKGLSPKAKVSYTENNDTGESYTVKVEGRAGASADYAELDCGVNENNYTLAEAAVTTYDSVNSDTSVSADASLTNRADVRYTNTLAAVSPTGIVLRFAPFILIAVFGVVFFIASRKTGEKKKDADII